MNSDVFRFYYFVCFHIFPQCEMYVLYVLLFGQTWQIGSSIKVLYDHPVELVRTVTTFKYVEGGPDREAQEVV